MKSIYRLLILTALFLVSSLSTALSFEGPLQVKNLYPIFLHADQQYIEKAAMENSISYSLLHSTTHTVQESGRWTIHLDMEITELNFRYRRIIKDLVELNLDIPVLLIGKGFMDSPLAEYHDAFGFGDYGRSERPDNEFLYEVKKDGVLIIEGRSGIRLGDLRIALKRPFISSEDLTLSIRGDIEIPVSSAEQGFSNGSVDAGISLLLDKRISDRTMLYLNLGAVFPGDVRGYETLDINNFIHGGAAVETGLWENTSLILQLQGQSGIYPQTDLGTVDRNAYLLTIGGRHNRGDGSFEFSLTEDLSVSGAPDFIMNLTYKQNL